MARSINQSILFFDQGNRAGTLLMRHPTNNRVLSMIIQVHIKGSFQLKSLTKSKGWFFSNLGIPVSAINWMETTLRNIDHRRKSDHAQGDFFWSKDCSMCFPLLTPEYQGWGGGGFKKRPFVVFSSKLTVWNFWILIPTRGGVVYPKSTGLELDDRS